VCSPVNPAGFLRQRSHTPPPLCLSPPPGPGIAPLPSRACGHPACPCPGARDLLPGQNLPAQGLPDPPARCWDGSVGPRGSWGCRWGRGASQPPPRTTGPGGCRGLGEMALVPGGGGDPRGDAGAPGDAAGSQGNAVILRECWVLGRC